MSFLSLCRTVNELCAHADELPRVDELLTMLQQCFITVFKPSEPASGAGTTLDTSGSSIEATASPPAASSFASDEEEKLLVVHAVRIFHERGVLTHRDFLYAASYHPHAALFIHGLLQSLGGHSRLWFRTLQLACIEACSAVLRSIGVDNVRLCLPGVVSAAARYLSRAHTRTDSVQVKVAATDLLRETLNNVLTMPVARGSEGTRWVEDTVAHLGGVMHAVLSPNAILEGVKDVRSAVSVKRLTMELLTTPYLAEYAMTPFVKELTVAYTIASNLVEVEFAETSASDAEDRPGVAWASLHLPDTIWDIAALVEAVIEALHELRGVALLHVATTGFCVGALRDKLFSTDPARLQLLASVVRKCVRLVGTEMPVESLYGSREANRPPVAYVVDRFLMSCAHACALLPASKVDVAAEAYIDNEDGTAKDGQDADEEETAGEALSNLLLDEYEAVLQDWDLYMAHPPVLYVLTRVILWQFTPLTDSLRRHFTDRRAAAGAQDKAQPQHDLLPSPPQFITSRAFENLWSVVAPPHLWNITEDESLCSFQQIRHRHIVAATLLRFLGLAARDVLAPAVAHYGDEGAYSWERFRTLTLYLVLEKAAVSGQVSEAAAACLRAYAAASGAGTALAFFLDASPVVLEDASRAVREAFLRPAVASVLRGMIDTIVASTRTHQNAHPALAGDAGASPSVSSVSRHRDGGVTQASAQLAVLVRQRLSAVEAAAAVQRYAGLTEAARPRVASCLTAAIRVATESCQLARKEGDAVGMKGALILLRDCFDVAALVHYTSPLLPEDVDHERQTTSADPSIQQLQLAVHAALQTVLTHCMSHSHGVCVPFAVQVSIRALTVFIDTEECATWAERQRAVLVEAAAARQADRAKKKPRLPAGLEEEGSENDDEEDDEVDVDRAMQFLPLPPLPWPWTPTAHTAADVAHQPPEAEKNKAPEALCVAQRQHLVLPHSHLKTVYRVYLSLVALLKEPVSAFHTAAARPGRRSVAERRALEAIRITPSVFTVLDALESLWDFVGDFMSTRAIEEVLPLALVWYERATIPRIPTDTEVRLAHGVRRFAQRLSKVVEPESSKQAVARACQLWFTLTVDNRPETAEDMAAPLAQTSTPETPASLSLPVRADDKEVDVAAESEAEIYISEAPHDPQGRREKAVATP